MRSLLRHLPQGRHLPEPVWERRHRLVTGVAVVQALALGALAALVGGGAPRASALVEGAQAHALHGVEGLAAATVRAAVVVLVVLLPLGASSARFGRHLRAMASTTSLLAASAVLVHLSHGITEAHFHFFVMVGLAALYQDWAPFGVAIGLVLVHHAVGGTVAGGRVLASHDPAQAVGWAGVHAAAVLALSCTFLASWRLNEQQSLHDALTGLGNRTLLSEVVARRLQGRVATSVLYLDLDDFKSVNDTHGHATGDALLTTVAERLRGGVRGDDVVVRLGGDEFALVVAGGPAEALAVADRVLARLREPVVALGHDLLVHASIGITSNVVDGKVEPSVDVEVVLQQADQAMYAAKGAGKDRVALFACPTGHPEPPCPRGDGTGRSALEQGALGHVPAPRQGDRLEHAAVVGDEDERPGVGVER